MQVAKEYPMTSEAIFSVIARSFVSDYEEHSGEVLTADEVRSGLEYIMTFGKNNENESKVILNQYEEPKIYETRVLSSRGDTTVRYELTEKLEGKTVVTYTEKTKFPDIFSKINHRILYVFMKKKLQNRMQQNLDYLYKIALETNEK